MSYFRKIMLDVYYFAFYNTIHIKLICNKTLKKVIVCVSQSNVDAAACVVL